MTELKVAYCAGHGGKGSTPGKRTPDGEYEWNFNDVVVRAMAEELSKYEGVKLLRTDDASGRTDVSLRTRTNKANAWGADLYVSVHHNANTGRWGTWTGAETFIHPSASANSLKLAKAVQPRLVKAMGIKDRGIKRANFHIVRETRMPAILTEGGYMDSSIDIKAMRDDAKLKAQGIAIAQGIVEYAGLKLKAGAEPTKPATVTPGRYRVYTGTFATEAKAAQACENIAVNPGFNPFVKDKRVWTGVFSSLEQAEAAAAKIRKMHGYNPQVRQEG